MADESTLFKSVDYNLNGLLHYIDIGDIALPDIQRPFIWNATKVRDLLDSMYRGFPVGYLLFWENGDSERGHDIGIGGKAHKIPSRFVVDGQQRLTSLYAVFRGKPVKDKEYREITMEIGFRPRDAKFEVCDATTRKDPEFIANVSDLFASGKSSYSLINDFLKRLESKKPVSEDESETISHNLDRLFALNAYPFTALEISPVVEEEQVAEIFVRINSKGVSLNQSDFILTLLSVFWEEGRLELEKFCRESRQAPTKSDKPSPYNHFIDPTPDQILKVSIAIGFYRARLSSVYQILLGKDSETGQYLPEKRELQLEKLKEAQTKSLHLIHWHQFFTSILGAGFRSRALISSEVALLYSYAFYLIGKTRYGVKEDTLQRLVGRWFYCVTLSGRYTGSPESVMDGDLNRVRNIAGPEEFVSTLESIIETTLTGDFWTISLPNDLDTSSARSPYLFAYYAAQNKLGAPVLFSQKKISDLLDPSVKMKKQALDRHHLFPRSWLEKQGITEIPVINQTANYALLEWPDNIQISDAPPSEYFPEMKERFKHDPTFWARMCELHALPDGWENMDYSEFLFERRTLMAAIIRRGFESL